MPPKSRLEQVDGVECRLNLGTRMVVVGSGLVSNEERITFRLKSGELLDEAVRRCPKFARLAALAAGNVEPRAAAPADASGANRELAKLAMALAMKMADSSSLWRRAPYGHSRSLTGSSQSRRCGAG